MARRRLRRFAHGWMAGFAPRLANSATLVALREQGPQQVFRISPLLTKCVALWSLMAFFAADFPVRAATLYWDGVNNALWSLNTNWSTASNATTPTSSEPASPGV